MVVLLSKIKLYTALIVNYVVHLNEAIYYEGSLATIDTAAKTSLKINICEMVTILRYFLLPRILSCRQATLKIWTGRNAVEVNIEKKNYRCVFALSRVNTLNLEISRVVWQICQRILLECVRTCCTIFFLIHPIVSLNCGIAVAVVLS